MKTFLAGVFALTACASPVANGNTSPDPEATAAATGCYAVTTSGTPSFDAPLPGLIQLLDQPAPGFVNTERLAVVEPGPGEPRAPISSWQPNTDGTIELVLGGGYTGYVFTLRRENRVGWKGDGVYFADFQVEPTPPRLPITLRLRICP
jgi:hypothetical protein